MELYKETELLRQLENGDEYADHSLVAWSTTRGGRSTDAYARHLAACERNTELTPALRSNGDVRGGSSKTGRLALIAHAAVLSESCGATIALPDVSPSLGYPGF
jgi:hypothetical protein